jgi:hypothetical protein
MKEKYSRIAIDSKEEMKAVIHKLHADDIEVDYLLHKGKPAQQRISQRIVASVEPSLRTKVAGR